LIYRDHRAVQGRVIAEWSPGQPRAWSGFRKGLRLAALPEGSVVGTSSTRREAQAAKINPGLRFSHIRGNVGTRLHKLAENPGLDALILASAGLERLSWRIFPDGSLRGQGVPEGLLAVPVEPEEMVPCVGQGAIGIERRENDEQAAKVCEDLNHFGTFQSVTAERAFLSAMGGGCQSPIGAHARFYGHKIYLTTVVIADGQVKRAAGTGSPGQAEALGRIVAADLLEQTTPQTAPEGHPNA
jgi:hydroxymethylbilane synthase